jgi:hypothetical protein
LGFWRTNIATWRCNIPFFERDYSCSQGTRPQLWRQRGCRASLQLTYGRAQNPSMTDLTHRSPVTQWPISHKGLSWLSSCFPSISELFTPFSQRGLHPQENSQGNFPKNVCTTCGNAYHAPELPLYPKDHLILGAW